MAESTVSDKSGNFSLEFKTLKPGEKVDVRKIEKAIGYRALGLPTGTTLSRAHCLQMNSLAETIANRALDRDNYGRLY